MMTPAADALLDPSRRWRVVLRHHQAGQFGAFDFGAGGEAVIDGGRALLRLVTGFGPEVESVTEIGKAATAPAPDPRADEARALHAAGITWADIATRMGISRAQVRRLAGAAT